MTIDNKFNNAAQAGSPLGTHLAVLDGWRGLSILMVLGAHLLPLSPKDWKFNHGAGMLGMVLFFNLSGFLITSFLLKDQSVRGFLIRRFFRVIPLAWLYLVIALALSGASLYAWVSHFFFFANLPPKSLVSLTDHIWSLCVEIQFYVGVAILIALFRARGLLLLPVLALLFTALRVWDGVYYSSISYYRIDEILAGCTLALIYQGRLGEWPRRLLQRLPQWPLAVLLVLSCMPQTLTLNYFRPYLGMLLIGATIVNPGSQLAGALNRKFFIFLAGISYSLYVIHPMLGASWLGSGDVLHKYEKRPLLFAVLFLLAYISTHYYENRFIAYGRTLVRKVNAKRVATPSGATGIAAERTD